MEVNLAWNLKGALNPVHYNSAEELGGLHASSVFLFLFFFFASSGSHSRIECIAFTLS